MAFDHTGNVYVADQNNHRVQKFTADGTFLTRWGGYGSADGMFNLAAGVAVDDADHVYVSDYQNHRIQKFTADGTFLTTWGSGGTAAGQIQAPRGLALDASGNLFVADRGNRRIQVFATTVIRGTVTGSATGEPLEETWVAALRASDYRLVGGAVTDADGNYALPVAPGDHHIEFIDPHFSHDMEWYDGHGFDELGGSDPVTTTLGTTTTGVDAALFLPTGALEGTVTEVATGAPMPGAGVAVMSTSDHHPYSATRTGTDGSYRIDGLPPGDYWTVAALPDGTHQPTFAGGTPTPADATVLSIAADTTSSDVDIALPTATDGTPTETLQGTITDGVDGSPVSGVLVGALRAADFGFRVATFTDAGGHYTLTVPAGGYYLEFFDLDHAHEFEWFHDEPHPTSPADLVTVTAPATADEDLIPLHGTATGTVTQTGTGIPLAGIWVAVMSSSDGHGVAGTTTATDGTWTISGLDLDDYVVVYLDPSGRHTLEWHDDATDITSASPITIEGSRTTTITAALAPTG